MTGLPRRDLWVLPLISVTTILVMVVVAEITTRIGWPAQTVNSCRVTDPVLGFRFKPNCTSTMKTPEGPWYTNHYNACGYRGDAGCGPVPAGTRRVAVIGSSLSEGFHVEAPNIIAVRLGQDLAQLCGAPVDVQNLGASGYFGDRLVIKEDEALRAQAGRDAARPGAVRPGKRAGRHARRTGGGSTTEPSSLAGRLTLMFKRTRLVEVAQHFLFANPAVYVPLYLHYGDKADFLRVRSRRYGSSGWRCSTRWSRSWPAGRTRRRCR